MTDVYEIEQDYYYSGSYANDIKISPRNIDTKYADLATLTAFNLILKTTAGTHALGLSGSYSGYSTGKDMVLGNFNGTLHNFQNNFYYSSSISTYGDIYNFIKKNYSVSTKRNLKLFSSDEVFMDSIMPDPEEIYVSGTLDQVRNTSIIIQKPGRHYITASYMMLGYNISTSSFVYVDYLGNPLSSPSLVVDPHSDQIFLGNYVWPLQFPFENRYKNINRNIINIFETKTLTSSLMYFDTSQSSSVVFATEISAEPGILSYFKIDLPPTTFKGFANSALGICYAGLDDSYKTIGDVSHTPIVTKSFYSVVDIKTRTGTSLSTTNNDWIPPDKNSLLFHFYSFGDFLGKFASGLKTTIASPANGIGGALVRNWNYPGFAYVMDDPTTSANYNSYQYGLITGSLIGYDCRGYKYGIYKPVMDFSTAVFRMNKFGNPRDMLEQRLFTNFYSRNKIIGSIVNVEFDITSSYAITASNTSLNPRDSGIYDKEYKCGQPFFDDDSRM